MNDRRRAIQVLSQARDELSRRLIDRVVNAAPELLDEARGDSYGGEIDAIQEQIGARLASVNSMLAQIQSLPETSPDSGLDPQADVHRVTTAGVSFEVPLPQPVTNVFAESTLPAGAAVAEPAATEAVTAEPPNFADFVVQIRTGNLADAARTLVPLLDVKLPRAERCAARFAEQLEQSPEFLAKAMGLRLELATGGVNGPLMLLWECFGLQGPEAVAALAVLRARLSLST